MREILSVTEAGKAIAGEVTQYGKSNNWVGTNEISKELEKHLAKFNIGCTDPHTGTWSHRTGGTRYFTTINIVNNAKNKVQSILSSFKKK